MNFHDADELPSVTSFSTYSPGGIKGSPGHFCFEIVSALPVQFHRFPSLCGSPTFPTGKHLLTRRNGGRPRSAETNAETASGRLVTPWASAIPSGNFFPTLLLDPLSLTDHPTTFLSMHTGDAIVSGAHGFRFLIAARDVFGFILAQARGYPRSEGGGGFLSLFYF